MTDEMHVRRSDLEPDRAQILVDTLQAQQREAFSERLEADGRLSRANFLTNGSAAIAVLAFIGTGRAPSSILFALFLFSVGVVATVVQQRSLVVFYGALFGEAQRRLQGFLADELTVAQVANVKKVSPWASRLDLASGWVAQVSFVLGVVVSALVIVLGTPKPEVVAGLDGNAAAQIHTISETQ